MQIETSLKTKVAQGYKIAEVIWSTLHVCELCITCELSVGTCLLGQYDLSSQNACIISVRIRENLS